MRRPQLVLARILQLGITPELAPESAQLVTLTNATSIYVIAAMLVVAVVESALGLPALAMCAVASAALTAMTLALTASGRFTVASVWLIIAIDTFIVATSVVGGASFIYTLGYVTCGLPLLLLALRERLALGATVVVTAVMFALLIWPDALPGPFVELDLDDAATLSIVVNILAWLTLLSLIVVFALTRKAAEDKLRNTLLETQTISEAKSAFLANTSHELRTPMGAILGYADLLMTPNISPLERANFIRTIRRNGRHLLELVDRILDHAKIEAGQLDVARSSCALDRIVADVEALMQVRAGAKGVTLDVEYETHIPEIIETDPLRVRQILVNLIGNAIKFTPEGEVRLIISLERHNGLAELRFAVVDNGPGIDPAKLDEMFDPFVQADMSTQRIYGGTGLGLAISKELAGLLGGRLQAESQIGAGSTFIFTLHLGPTSELGDLVDARVAIEPTRVRTRTHSGMQGTRVLVAEDGFDNQRLIELYLQRVGAITTLAANGAVAVAAYETALDDERPFDIILMDMQMPVIDGYEATRTLREMGCQTPIIALTAHAMVGARDDCLAAGCDDYFVKPIDFDALFSAMLTRLGHQSDSVLIPFDPEFQDDTRDDTRDRGVEYEARIVSESSIAIDFDGNSIPVPIEPTDSQAQFAAQLASLARDFTNRLPERVAKLQGALSSGDLEQVRFLAHRLRGTAGTYGLVRVSELAFGIMNAADNDQQLPQIRGYVEELVELAAQASLVRS